MSAPINMVWLQMIGTVKGKSEYGGLLSGKHSFPSGCEWEKLHGKSVFPWSVSV